MENLIIANKHKSVILMGFKLFKDKNKKIWSFIPFYNLLKRFRNKWNSFRIINNHELRSINNISVFFTQDISQEILETLKQLKARESFIQSSQ